MTLTAFDGQAAYYYFLYESQYVQRACPNDDELTESEVELYFLTGVIRPDGTSFSMPLTDYITPVGIGGCNALSGRITGVTLPTRGKVEWTYRSYGFPHQYEPWGHGAR